MLQREFVCFGFCLTGNERIFVCVVFLVESALRHSLCLEMDRKFVGKKQTFLIEFFKIFLELHGIVGSQRMKRKNINFNHFWPISRKERAVERSSVLIQTIEKWEKI